jgi:hypothetical protein
MISDIGYPPVPPSGFMDERRPVLPLLGLTTDQAAGALGLSRRTLEGWRVKGGGPAFVKLTRGVVRYRPEDLHSWLVGRLVQNTAQGTALG